MTLIVAEKTIIHHASQTLSCTVSILCGNFNAYTIHYGIFSHMSEVNRERRGTIGSTSEQAILESFLCQIKVFYFPPSFSQFVKVFLTKVSRYVVPAHCMHTTKLVIISCTHVHHRVMELVASVC